MFVRMLKIIVIHLLFAGLGVGAVWALTQNQGALGPSVFGFGAPGAAIAQMLERLRSAMMVSCAIAVGWSALSALAWTWVAERAAPGGETQARAYRGPWAGLFLLALSGVAAAGWIALWRTRMAALADPMTLWIGAAVAGVAVFLAYWLATAATVRLPMLAAVPGAFSLRRLTKRRA